MENTKNFRIAIFMLCAVYAGARLWQLTDSCLWFDEIFSVHAAEQTWSGLWSFVAQDLIHPPLFYGLLKIWIGVGGDGLFWLRLLPVMFSFLALFPFIHLCRELKLSRWTIVIAVGLLAFNGGLIKYSQTLRMYSLLMLLSLMSIWLFARYFNRGKSWIWLVVVNVLLVYTHYFGWLVVGAEFLTILLFQRIKIGRAAVMVGISAAAFAPWLITILNREQLSADLDQNIAWQPRAGIGELGRFLLTLVEPFYSPASSLEPSSIRSVALPLVLLSATAIAIFLSREKSQDEKTFAKFAIVFTAFPLLTAFALSWLLPNSIWGARHLIVVTPIFLILFAAAVSGFQERWLRIGALSVICILIAVAFVHELRRPITDQVWCSWESVEKEIRATESSNNQPPTIYAFEDHAAYHLWFASRKAGRENVVLAKGIPVRTSDRAYFLPRGFDGVGTVNVDKINDPELWLAFRVFQLNEEFPIIEAFTSRGYRVCDIQQKAYGTNRVFRVKLAQEPTVCGSL